MFKSTFIQKKFFLLCFIVSNLSGCSVFGPVESENTASYTLSVNGNPPTKKPRRPTTLFVAPVEANSIYNTNQMAYSTKPYQIAYFAKSRWAETPSAMLQPLMVKTLQKTDHFRIVSSMLSLGSYDYALNTQLIEMKQVFWANASQLHLKLRAQLVSSASGRIIAIKEFNIIENVGQPTPYGGVLAANRATAILLNQLAAFCLQKI